MDVLVYSILRKYINDSLDGVGALRGKNCVIDSITNITDSESNVIGKRVTFQWTSDSGVVSTSTMDVMYGVKGDTGLGIKDVSINNLNHLIITYDDDTTDDAGELTNLNTSMEHITDIDIDNPVDGQILKYNGTTHKWENASAGSVDTNLSDLHDVDLDNVADGQIIVWDAENNKWKNANNAPTIEIDDTPTEGSENAVSSGGVFTALGDKQDTLTFDDAPTENSDNPVKSDGIFDALAGKQDTLTFDNAPTENSNNPVKSGGVYTALADKVDKVTGKGLSTEDYTTEDKTKLGGLANIKSVGSGLNLNSSTGELTAPIDSALSDLSTNPVQNSVVKAAIDAKADTSDLGTAAAKDSTTYVNPNNHDLPDANAVYQAMTSMLEGAFHPAGNKTVAELTSALLVQANVGNVYKITDNGVTSAEWVGGAGQTITAGQMAVVVYGNTAGTFLYNLENGINIDMSLYQTKLLTAPITVDGVQKTNVEDTLGAINTLAAGNKTDIGNIKDGQTLDSFADVESVFSDIKDGSTIDSFGDVETALGDKADKITGGTENNFVAIDGSGNIKDSGKKTSDFASSAIMDGQSIDSFGDVETALGNKSNTADVLTRRTAATVQTDFDTITDIGEYIFSSSSYVQNAPVTSSGTLLVFDTSGYYRVQIFRANINNKTYIRSSVNRGTSWSDWEQIAYATDITGKADKVSSATVGNLASLDVNGNLVDSGVAATKITAAHDEDNGTSESHIDLNTYRTAGTYFWKPLKPSYTDNAPSGINESNVLLTVCPRGTSTGNAVELVQTLYHRNSQAIYVRFCYSTTNWTAWRKMTYSTIPATAGNFAALDASGNLTDSGYKVGEISDAQWSQIETILGIAS